MFHQNELSWGKLVLLLCALCVGFEYEPLPETNLVANPWFQVDCESSLEGWSVNVTPSGSSWGGSEKTQNPTAVDCQGDFTGHAARWARQTSSRLEFAPDEDARIWQIVGPVDSEATTLHFHALFVFHRMNRFRAQISGGPSPEGPWTEVWVPIDEQWLEPGGPNAPFEGTCPGGMIDRDCLWDKVTQAELGSLEPITHEVEQGYPYYRIELLGNYPEPDAMPTGDVGGKVTRVYFAVGPAGSSGTTGSGQTGTSGTGTGTSTGTGTASSSDSGSGNGGLGTTGGNATNGDGSGGSGGSAGGTQGAGVGESSGCGCRSTSPDGLAACVLGWLVLLTSARRRRSTSAQP